MSDHYEYEAPQVADELSVVARHGGGGPEVPALPAAEPAEDVDYEDEDFTDYWSDSGDGGDHANEPDPARELAVEAFRERLTMQEQHEAWERDYAQRHNDAMSVKTDAEMQEAYHYGDRLIDSALGHTNTTEGMRSLIWNAAEAIMGEHGPGLRQQGWPEDQIAAASLTQATELVRDAAVSDHAIKASGLNRR